MSKRSKIMLRVITHIIIVGGLFFFLFLPLIWCFTFPLSYWIKQGIFYLLYIGIFYSTLYLFVPYLLNKHRTFIFIGTMSILCLLMLGVNKQIDESLEIKALLIEHFHLNYSSIGRESDLISDGMVFIITLLLISSSTIIGVASKIQKDALSRKELEGDKATAELAFLKAQINPHFLFNTLNSIFVLTAGNEKANDAVYNLSKMLRYVLYDTEEGNITLEKEIHFLKEFISLMQLRLTDNVRVSFSVDNDLQDTRIAPMLFLPLVENAFKHGVSGMLPCEISFRLRQKNNALTFTCSNTLLPERENNCSYEKGIGLANTKRRLELLYPNRYSLVTSADQKKRCFITVLKIVLP